MSRRPSCPECGSDDVAEIVYGFPGPELAEQAERGEVILGGCCVPLAPAKWGCHACDHEWGHERPRSNIVFLGRPAPDETAEDFADRTFDAIERATRNEE